MLINQSGRLLVELWNVKSINLQGSFEGAIICGQLLTSHGCAICYRVGSNQLSSGVFDPCQNSLPHGINHDHYRSACTLAITLTHLLLIFNRERCAVRSLFLTDVAIACSLDPLAFITPTLPAVFVYPLRCDSYLSVIWLPLSAFPARGSLFLGACSTWSDKSE